MRKKLRYIGIVMFLCVYTFCINTFAEEYQPLSVTLGVPSITDRYIQSYGTVFYFSFEATVTGGMGPYKYSFQMKRDGNVVYTSPTYTSSSNTFTYTANTGYTGYTTYMDYPGLYTATVTVTDENGDTAFALSDGYCLKETGYRPTVGTCCPNCKSPYKITAPAEEPTCLEEGFTEGELCADCGTVLTGRTPIQALGHDWGEPTYYWSDENSKVTAVRICSRNEEHVDTETVNTQRVLVSAPTTTEPGVFAWYSEEFTNNAFAVQEREDGMIPKLSDMNILQLPSMLAEIDEEAFAGSSCDAVIIPEGCTTIKEHAFANCSNLLYVKIPSTVKEYPENTFEGCNRNIVIHWCTE